jgi:DNA helicase-2/ATP-dependent DNA helicase PcrA
MIAYMRLVTNPADDVSLERIINEPKRGIGEGSMSKIRAYAKACGKSLFDCLGDPEVLDGLSSKASMAAGALYSVLGALHVEKDNMSVADIYDELLVKTDYLPVLEEMKTVEADGRIENLLEFKSVIAEKEKELPDGEVLTLDNFMEGLALISDVDNHDPEQDAVVLMTLHSAKGLEFPVVFMPGMETGLFPSYRSADREDGLEEERRLCYVGMTRAKQRLFMTSAEQRMLYGKTDRASESPFLKENDKKYMTGHAVYDKRGDGDSFDRYSADSHNYSFGPYISPLSAAKSSGSNAKSVAQLLKPKYTVEGQDLQPGDKVKHDKFGEGTVIELKGSIVTVIFESAGTKKLAVDKAPMKKI